MPNLAEWIEDEADGDEISCAVIGEMGWGDYGSEDVAGYKDQPKGEILAWADARQWLDYEFNCGYGAPGCNAVYAWTSTKVIMVGQYDGSTWVYSVPRNPMDCMPIMQGG